MLHGLDRLEFLEDGSSQRLWFMAQEGRPSATPTVVVKDRAGTTLTASTDSYTTQDSVNTTIAASAAAGATQLTVASGTSIRVGAWYRLVNALSQIEWVQCRGVTGTTVYLDAELQYNFSTDRGGSDYGDFESTEFYYTLQAADVADLSILNRATATYTVNSISYTQRREYDVVASPLWNPMTVAALYGEWPDLAAQEPQEQRGSDYERQRENAFRRLRSTFRRELTARGMRRPAAIYDEAAIYEWMRAEMIVELEGIGVSVVRDQNKTLAELKQERDSMAAQAMATVYLDRDQDEGAELPALKLDMFR